MTVIYSLRVVDAVNSAGNGKANKDVHGSSPVAAWVIDRVTDASETYMHHPQWDTAAQWIAHCLSKTLSRTFDFPSPIRVFAEVEKTIDS